MPVCTCIPVYIGWRDALCLTILLGTRLREEEKGQRCLPLSKHLQGNAL